jgi:hypothetical protein
MNKLIENINLFCKLANENHYKVDMSNVANILDMYNDEDVKDKEKMDYVILPLSDIRTRPIWSKEKLSIVKNKIQSGVPLEPITLVRSKNEKPPYNINDGVHRTEASRQLGMTHIPALLLTYLE